MYRSMQTVTNMYICSVASADFILTVLATPFQAKVHESLTRWINQYNKYIVS